ncbi:MULTISPECIES: GNAT family N-acetyltransferase [unclassified Microbacterium]|uniref:GNAT family N-acetyltransferase n=1 Tax=unclassified Microbacterium TaxID=2609290 RepID=UPI002469BBD6|nr:MULTISPECIES: GNAT family N-acetyltransferase [unclassified Microbacterium]MDH5133558.1 GNAT family N-acetyltransferase [Microbacterium sp. RD10]MDH5138100.1 GNAT family N-acetyltransferase [Microbacterium sp. RD11]MDH5145985.1 GNAT family N-acetyltransferase [Microbacterium sp. RD12]MDH5156031.1 GNAT family N-acetyltransferase [Microbacterium sp. RD06]MDH5167020.1 GNAT family N-acetyltransferase [Microbacterium sp. RD02]
MTTAALTITPLIVPATLADVNAADFRAYGALNRQICDEQVGLPDLAPDAAQMLPNWQDDSDALDLGFVAREGDDIIGMVTVSFAQEEDAHAAELDLLVPAAHTGRGVEDALLDCAETEARERGRSVLQIWTLHRPEEADRMLQPRTGWGRIPATPLSDVVEARDFTLEQVERNSELDLRADPEPLRRALDAALAVAGPDYRVVEWELPTPPEFRDGYAAVLARLSTDAPSGDMDFVAEVYDADRVVRRDARLTGAGQTVSVVAVEHVPSGTLVAYNELLIGAEKTGTTHQFGTLVAKDHRGHRLGTIVKCANLLRWRELVPDSDVVSTFNAEENRPMLDINEAIGFVPVSYAGAWQKKI